MKEFRSIFKQDFADYIETNQGTISNDTLRNTRSVLLTFDSLLAKENTGEISEAIVNQWIKRLHQVNAPKTVSDKVSYLRKFLRYLQYKGYVVFYARLSKNIRQLHAICFFGGRNTDTFIQCRPMV